MIGRSLALHGASVGGGVLLLSDIDEDGVVSAFVGNVATSVPGLHCFCFFPQQWRPMEEPVFLFFFLICLAGEAFPQSKDSSTFARIVQCLSKY